MLSFNILFVSFEKALNSSLVIVFLDKNYLTSFSSKATDQESFESDCMNFTKTQKYKEAINEAQKVH